MANKAFTAKQMKTLDRAAIEEIGIPSIVLMENAGRAVAHTLLADLKKVPRPKVCIVCGVGNNAGDGLVAARHLMNRGVAPLVFMIGGPDKLKADARTNYRILERCGCAVKPLYTVDHSLRECVNAADILVDAIFGVGINREIGDPFASVITTLNESGKKILAVDIASGLDATTGDVWGVCIRAHKTVTLSVAKQGMLQNAGPRHSGRIVTADIGIPLSLLQKF